MKKIILTAASILVVTGAGISYVANANQTEPSGGTEPVVSKYNDVSTIQNLAEYKALNELMAINHFEPEIVEDTTEKRIILLKDQEGEAKYKSVYIKTTNRLKVVDFNRGVVVDQIIQSGDENIEVVFPDDKQDHASKNEIESLKEYDVLSERLPIEKLDAEVIENHKNKRVILFSKDGKEQYKSIYVERSNRLKIVDFKQGLIFNDVLGKSDQVVNEEKEVSKQETATKKEEASLKADQPVAQAPKQETVKKEQPVAQTPKQETVKKEQPKQEAPKATVKKEEPTAQAPKKEQATPKAEKPQKETPKKASSGSGYKEMSTIKNHVNMSGLSTQVVEDNQGKRIILLKDGNGKPQYKSIYVKRKGYLKIIKMRGGLVFNGQI